MLHEYVFAFVNHLQAQASGGARRDRTADPLLAKQVLSQLSYSPFACPFYEVQRQLKLMMQLGKLVGLGRFELPTSPLSGVRSNQLSYRPKYQGDLKNHPCHPGHRSAKKTEQVLGYGSQQTGF